MKECYVCHETKELEFFTRNPRVKCGRTNLCKKCSYNRLKEKIKNNPEHYKELRKKLYYKDLEKSRQKKRESIAKYKDKKVEYDIIYREENKEKIAAYKKEWDRKKKNEPLYKMKKNLRRRIHHLIKNGYKSKSTVELIGCSFEDFKKHIESLFTEGMSWENYGFYGWHIDHIIPCNSFDLTDVEQQKICFHYTNQQPLWMKDNLKKGRKI